VSIPGVTPRVRRDGSTSYEAQVRRLRVNGRAVSPISRTFPTEAQAVLRAALTARAGGAQRAPQLRLDVSGRPLSPNMVSNAFEALVRVFVASPEGRAVHAEPITLHGTRHSFVINHLAAGTPMATVSKQTGNAPVALAVSVCGHLLDDHAADALPVLSPDVAA